ncbi:hypothetical protein [Variovorax terrae]|uniref:JAB domain-containing protein n=1 Tax=Variovorax terrae TaxID=2923278 RepID=A0A9X1VYR4_9BURK|nr:hypothetical protein [Variovorax terrae]MCJ0766126.1 hypothetical protein [Variovorax terrae]
MKTHIKIAGPLLSAIRADLHRRHPFAFERVGFLTAGARWTGDGDLVLLCRDYQPVVDEDYERSSSVGARIGSNAMRKVLQAAYQHKSAILHIHTHGGRGRPEFSAVDLNSARDFVPGFFNALPQMPHGIVVLSNDSARCLLWTGPKDRPRHVDGFQQVGAPLIKFGAAHEPA